MNPPMNNLGSLVLEGAMICALAMQGTNVYAASPPTVQIPYGAETRPTKNASNDRSCLRRSRTATMPPQPVAQASKFSEKNRESKLAKI